MAEDVTTLFCYGTLMRGQANHARYCSDVLTIEPAVTAGRLYQLPMGYPAMIEPADGQVFGEVMTFPDISATLREIDRLEGYRPDDPEHSLYIRRIRPVSLLRSGLTVPAYCYVWRGALPSGSVRLAKDRWFAEAI